MRILPCQASLSFWTLAVLAFHCSVGVSAEEWYNRRKQVWPGPQIDGMETKGIDLDSFDVGGLLLFFPKYEENVFLPISVIKTHLL